MTRFGPGLTRRSVGVLPEHPELPAFPALSAASLLLFFVGGVPAFALIAIPTGVGEGIIGGYWEFASLAVGHFIAAVPATGGGVVFAGVFVVGSLSLFVVLLVRAAAHGGALRVRDHRLAARGAR